MYVKKIHQFLSVLKICTQREIGSFFLPHGAWLVRRRRLTGVDQAVSVNRPEAISADTATSQEDRRWHVGCRCPVIRGPPGTCPMSYLRTLPVSRHAVDEVQSCDTLGDSLDLKARFYLPPALSHS